VACGLNTPFRTFGILNVVSSATRRPGCLSTFFGIAVLSVSIPACSREPKSAALPEAAAERTPRRILALAPNAVEVIFALGAGDRVVGVSRYTVYPPEALQLPRIGGLQDPDLETIVGLDPDLVILRGRQAKLEKLCSERGIGVYHDPTETLGDIERTIVEFGRLLGRPQQAGALRDRMRERLERVRAAASRYPPVKVLFTLRSPDRLVDIGTVSRGSYLHELVELAGGDNIFGGLDAPYPLVSVEEILARGPEVIIEAMPGASIDSPDVLVEQWRRVGPIPAVRNGRVYLLTEDYVNIPSPRVVLLAENLLTLLHPEALPDE
jgi:iron complex transport system substrate-binding protein